MGKELGVLQQEERLQERHQRLHYRFARPFREEGEEGQEEEEEGAELLLLLRRLHHLDSST